MPTLAGMIASCIVGIFALKILIAVSRKRNLKIFALYCLILAMMTFVSLL
jgi:undecaprenyl pyrophosphate phosphatase UppP